MFQRTPTHLLDFRLDPLQSGRLHADSHPLVLFLLPDVAQQRHLDVLTLALRLLSLVQRGEAHRALPGRRHRRRPALATNPPETEIDRRDLAFLASRLAGLLGRRYEFLAMLDGPFDLEDSERLSSRRRRRHRDRVDRCDRKRKKETSELGTTRR